ncbi:condensation domain-containing protein, partial [Sphaerisporangium sp. TRM90804]|uniref:condensation domain-containing protein n=1 Tax=Sphaerisporangium sp. TRM90804 TaxID=3031113 RepID=UPI00244BF0DC
MIPLSFAQRRLWFLHGLEGPAYNMPWTLRFRGDLDVDALRAALGDVVARHEALRTVFPERDGEPYQMVLSPDEAKPELEVLHPGEELPQALDLAARYRFDLGGEPLVRAHLFVLGPRDHVLMLLMHHIVCDGWSFAPLSRDLMAAYEAHSLGDRPSFPELPVQYVDYTLWQRDLLGDAGDPESLLSRQTAYWRDRLAGLPEHIPLPADRPRPAVASYDGELVTSRWDGELHEGLTRLARETGTSLFMVLQAGLAALLTRMGSGTDVPVGVPIAGRTDEALDDLVGFFVNTLVLRTDTSGEPTFAELLARVRETALEAYANQDVPFEHLVEVLNPARSAAYHPLFQVLLVVQNSPDDSLRLKDLELSPIVVPTGTARFDLMFSITHSSDPAVPGLTVGVEFSTDLFDRSSVVVLVERLRRLLAGAVADPGRRLGLLPVLDPAERELLLGEWISTGEGAASASPGGSGVTVAGLLCEALSVGGDGPAVVGVGGELSFAELGAA